MRPLLQFQNRKIMLPDPAFLCGKTAAELADQPHNFTPEGTVNAEPVCAEFPFQSDNLAQQFLIAAIQFRDSD